jgi:cephalosporin-C deacetylase-like acetyl esterase
MKTEKQSVEFLSQGMTVRGDLYLPTNGTGPFPVVVMAGGWCYVKELVMPSYARYFLDAGFAVLIFDYRHFGASDGQPRQHIDPWGQIEDYRNAISYVQTLKEIDRDRVGIWGISYSGGHVLVLGATDPRVKCVVSNIPVVDGWTTMWRVHGTVEFRRLRAKIAEDREQRSQTQQYGYIDMSGQGGQAQLVTWADSEIREVFLKIKATDAPSHEHINTIASVENLLTYDISPYPARILDTPTHMIVASGDDLTMWDLEVAMFHRIATAKKELFVIPQTSHMALYSSKTRLQIAGESAAKWFTRHLAPLS